MTKDETRARVVRLLMEHRSGLFAYIYAAVRDFDLAEEVFQEVSVAVCESCEAFQSGTNFSAWAREIARRRILAEWRSNGRFPQLLSDEALRQLAHGFDQAQSRWTPQDRLAALRACLTRIKPAARRLLELRYASQLRLGEIASRVGRRGETVRKALFRVRQTLRKCIERRIRAEEGA